MQSACSERDPDTAPRQTAAVLAARIRQQLDEVRGTRLEQLLQLRARLQAEVFAWDNAPLAQALAALHSAGRGLHCQPLRQGWLARVLGRRQMALAQFRAAHDRTVTCASQVKTRLAELASGSADQLLAMRRMLAELDTQWQGLNAGIDEGVTRLQEMCARLSDARRQGDDDPQLAALAEMAQLFTQEFKRLQSVSTTARDIAMRGKGVLARRAALLEQARADMAAFDQTWTQRLDRVVAGLEPGRNAAPDIPKAVEVHEQLMRRLAAAADACAALQQEEHLLGHQLGMLRQELETRER